VDDWAWTLIQRVDLYAFRRSTDPFRASHGTLALRAYRLNAKVMQLFKNKTFSMDTYAEGGRNACWKECAWL